MKYVSWDIETHKILPEGCTNIMEHRPLGITCIALTPSDNRQSGLFYSGFPDDPLPRKMNQEELSLFVDELWAGFISGYKPLAWNGNFDFQILLEELNEKHLDVICQMARNSVDPMFQLFAIKGYPLGLESAANGMDIKGKTKGMSGALAPEMWQESLESRQKVLEYVAQDTIIPLDLVKKIEETKLIEWTSRSGRQMFCNIDPIMTVEEARKIPEPDTSWMTNPIPRSAFYGWAFEE